MQTHIQFDSNFKEQHIRHMDKFDKTLVAEKKLWVLFMSKSSYSGAVQTLLLK